MGNLLKITRYTLADIVHHRAVYIALGVSVVFILLVRGCYGGAYNVNGRSVDAVTVAWHISKIAFHVIAAAALLVAAMIAMRQLRRDREDGSVAYMLSRPVARWQYVMGRAAGLWFASSFFMVVLHATVFGLTYLSAGGTLPGYLGGSLVCTLNLLLMVLVVSVLSLVMPDFLAGIVGLGIGGVSFASDSLYRVMQSDLVRSAIHGRADAQSAAWRLILPKIGSLQYFASSLIGEGDFRQMGPVHPLINVALYCALAGALLVLRFRAEEL